LNEIDLISGLKSKNLSAINYFVNNNQQFVFVLCIKMLNDKEVAEELTQDVLIKCIEKINLFEGKSKLKTWVYKIAHNEVLNYLRKNKLNTTALNEETINFNTDNSLIEDMNEKDIKQFIQIHFEKLPVDQREMLTLFYLEELSLKEIGEITELSLSNVRVKLYRAREKFRMLLNKNDVNLLKQLRYG
jgi:RNA polymerase sigma-70 factor (ECF subfamily)